MVDKTEDLTGNVYGRLTVVSYSHKKRRNCGKRFNHYWNCVCICGKNTKVTRSNLLMGRITSCGCSKIGELSGRRFGKLLVEKFSHTKNGKAYWECLCNCGNKNIARGASLTGGLIKSCGCIIRDDLSGRKFYRLKVIDFAYVKNKKAYWNCVCACGNTAICGGSALKRGNHKSCGCKRYLRDDELDLIKFFDHEAVKVAGKKSTEWWKD